MAILKVVSYHATWDNVKREGAMSFTFPDGGGTGVEHRTAEEMLFMLEMLRKHKDLSYDPETELLHTVDTPIGQEA